MTRFTRDRLDLHEALLNLGDFPFEKPSDEAGVGA